MLVKGYLVVRVEKQSYLCVLGCVLGCVSVGMCGLCVLGCVCLCVVMCGHTVFRSPIDSTDAQIINKLSVDTLLTTIYG